MSIILDDRMHEDIRARCRRALDVDSMTPGERENFFRKNRERKRELEKWFAEHEDKTGVDWTAPSEGLFAAGETVFEEDEYDPSISEEEEEELIRESEENSVDSCYLTDEELMNFFAFDDDEQDRLKARSVEGDRISMEMFGVAGTQNMSRSQIDRVRERLGLVPRV